MYGPSGSGEYAVHTAASMAASSAVTRASCSEYAVERDVVGVDSALAPELARERLGRRLHGPGAVRKSVMAPDPAQEDPQAPVVDRVAEEEQVAAPQTGRDLHGDRPGRLDAGEVVDVVVFADGEALELPRRPVVDMAVDLEQHAALLEREAGVGVRLLDDRRDSPLGLDVQELAAVPPGGEIRRRRRALRPPSANARSTPVSKRRRHDQLLRQPPLAQQRRQAREPAVEERRLEVPGEREVELVVQRTDAVARGDGLRHVCEAAAVDVELEAVGEERGELVTGDAADTRAEDRHEPAGGERAHHLVVVVVERGRRGREAVRAPGGESSRTATAAPGPGSMPSSSTSVRRASWYAASASAWRPHR